MMNRQTGKIIHIIIRMNADQILPKPPAPDKIGWAGF